MDPKHKSVRVRLLYDQSMRIEDRCDGDGEWYRQDRDHPSRPDGGFHKVTPPGREDRDHWPMWIKPDPTITRPMDVVDMWRAWYRDSWTFVIVAVEQVTSVVGSDGKEYTGEFGDACGGVEYGYARRSSPGEPSEHDPTGRFIMNDEVCAPHIREIARDCAGQVEYDSGVAIPEDELAEAIDKAVDSGPTWEW